MGGKERESVVCGNKVGRVGNENGIGAPAPRWSGGNVGDVGDEDGVFRRTYVDIGVFSVKSDTGL